MKQCQQIPWDCYFGEKNHAFLLDYLVNYIYLWEVNCGSLIYTDTAYFRKATQCLDLSFNRGQGSLVAQMVKNLPSMLKTRVRSLGQEDLLEKGMATHSSILAWKIPWTEEPDGLRKEKDMTEWLTLSLKMSHILLFPLIAVDGGQSAKYSLKVMFNSLTWSHMGSKYSITLPVAQLVKNLPVMWETWVRSLLGKIPWRRERLPTPVFWPGESHGLQSMESQRVGHDWVTFTFPLNNLQMSQNVVNPEKKKTKSKNTLYSMLQLISVYLKEKETSQNS